jgi:hypothetical protein
MMAEDEIRANAQWVLDRFSSLSKLHEQFGYNHESVKWVEGFIEQQRSKADITPDAIGNLAQMIGSSLGECIIHTYGGNWKEQDDECGIFFDDSNAVFPFSKVSKQFQNGLSGGDSILSFFELIGPVILKRS